MDYREAIEKVLLSKGCSIWGRPFSIDQQKDRDRCIDWILNSIVNPMLEEIAKSDPRAAIWAFEPPFPSEPPRSPQEPRTVSDGASLRGLLGKPAQSATAWERLFGLVQDDV